MDTLCSRVTRGAAVSCFLALAWSSAFALSALDKLSASEQTSGLKTALTQAAQAAVTRLGKADGFLGDPEVRIPLPGKLQKAEHTLKLLGLNKQSDALVLAMNRAAEAAVPEARSGIRRPDR